MILTKVYKIKFYISNVIIVVLEKLKFKKVKLDLIKQEFNLI